MRRATLEEAYLLEKSYLEMEEALLDEIGVAVGKLITEDEAERIRKQERHQKELLDLCSAIIAYYEQAQADYERRFVQGVAMQAAAKMKRRIFDILPEETAIKHVGRQPIEQDPKIMDEVERFAEISKSIKRSALTGANKIYDDILKQAAREVQIGRKSYQKAAQDATKEWAKNGIPVLRTKNGAKLTIDGYVPMVIRAEQKRASTVAQEGELDAYGIDLVEMSSHAGSRPSHVPFQGRIYSRSGTSDRYPPLSTTGYGAVDGMVTGINCRHQMYPYIEGVSGKRFEPYDAEESKQKYLESQQQRHLEREIRRAKREKRALENTGADALEVKRANGKIRKRQAALRAFVEKTGRTRRYEREQLFSGTGAFHNIPPEQFSKALSNAKKTVPERMRWRVSAFEKEEHPNALLHITPGGSTVAIDKGDIISVCRRKGDTMHGDDIIHYAVEHGGVKLDSYSGNHDFYQRCGFEPVSWCRWNGEFAPPDWKKEFREEPVVFYKYVGKNARQEPLDVFLKRVPASADYGAAHDKRERALDAERGRRP
ncbi:phage minor capsid protein [Peptoniphilaceae bacterium SGI.097]